MTDPRRNIPRTDELLKLPEVEQARAHVAEPVIRSIVDGVLNQARRGQVPPEDVASEVTRRVGSAQPYSLRPVINATGVIVHTNLGRAPLPPAAVDALVAAASYTDVELDLKTGLRSKHRGRGAVNALLAACPAAEDALIVNNGAAALLLATAALAPHQEVIISRGELIEIGAGFRLPELIESSHVRLREIGATNRTHLHDYVGAIGPESGAILKVHPSNFRITGFTSSVSVEQLRPVAQEHGIRLIVDLGSGLLTPDATLPDEPDLHAQLAAGADVVIASGDKLLGGPQAGILLGTQEAIACMKKHPLARALRVDKLRLNALEAALNTPSNAVADALHVSAESLKARTEAIAAELGAQVVEHAGRVGGGGAPEYPLPGYAIALDDKVAGRLRKGSPAVLARVHDGRCLVDLRCVPPGEDPTLLAALKEAI
ncbi:L-seryl-tRNA(Sec) selenium transferase [Corynebacterium confusum]|uniref:L-seryl-tRNA(Sec) selenium transferase n=1 Tax=Corynebacterium confusum TaxID=71254 RepID=UPI0025B3D9F8|nr:L-seryl-tRNA(Sec) selenium transferase [Corynebacterium confusum]WJY89451.1 L-seryl-tRNA(Sec) selenium transferase [Corynebacterium confusum]